MSTDSLVLIVDDEPLVAEYLADVLQGFGFRSAVAGSFVTAIDLLQKGTDFCAAFVDLGLTDRSGLELIAELQEARPTLPVILATGYAEMAENDQSENGQRYPILAKPYDADAVGRVLNDVGLPARMASV